MRKQLVTRRASRAKHARRHSASMEGALSNWTNSIVSRREAERQIERASERALDLYHNDAMAHGVIESQMVEAVGIGLTPQPAPRGDWLGLSADWEAEFQTAASRCWEEWGLDCRHWCDATRRMAALTAGSTWSPGARRLVWSVCIFLSEPRFRSDIVPSNGPWY